VCSGATVAAGDAVAEGRRPIVLDSVGRNPNVKIRFEDVIKTFRRELSGRLVDFLEIASYVFTADCAVKRGEKWTDEESREPWERDLSFVIAVRDTAFWNAPIIKDAMEQVLGFLSSDKYSFKFVPLETDREGRQPYFDFNDRETWPFHSPERVLMFSGGLDSLAGAVESAANGAKLVLVSHRSVTTIDTRQKKLFKELHTLFPGQMVRIPVWINKSEVFGREPTQRTRSFLYTVLGTLVAQSVQAGGVRFYENGIVSVNLPIAEEALRARASRTTHPMALHLMSSLCAAVTDRTFVVDNPFLFKTKTEVVESLATNNAAHLIPLTCSCSHSMFQTKTQRHCGGCSQCTDRRFATMAAGLLDEDSASDYVSDVFVGPRRDARDKAIAIDYTNHGIELNRLSENELAVAFNAEVGRAVRYEPRRSEAAQKIIAMHKRHGHVVSTVLERKVRENAAELLRGTLPATSLLVLAVRPRFAEEEHALQPQLLQGVPTGAALDLSHSSLGAPLLRIEGMLANLVARGAPVNLSSGKSKKKRTAPSKRDTIIFAALVKALQGPKYCSFLDAHGLKLKTNEPNAPGYAPGYRMGDPLRKKIQDEKSRARRRMAIYENSALAEAFSYHLQSEFDELSALLHSRHSRDASKSSASGTPNQS
jgi:hypothetical protein